MSNHNHNTHKTTNHEFIDHLIHWIHMLNGIQTVYQHIEAWKKKANILSTTSSNAFSSMQVVAFLQKNSLKFAPTGPTDNESALVQLIAWCWTGENLNQYGPFFMAPYQWGTTIKM